MDFVQRKFAELCVALKEAGYSSLTLEQLIAGQENLELEDKCVVLRHDVDRLAAKALELARIESEHGLVATYYFRIPGTFNEAIIRAVSDLGHEVGLHYESLDRARGDLEKAGELFAEDLAKMRAITTVKTVTMHGNPFTPFDNRDIWKQYSFEQFDLVGEGYLAVNFEKLLYYSDTGRTWEDGKYNIKDVIPDGQKRIEDKPPVATTSDLIRLIQSERRNLYILTHPLRWKRTLPGWCFSAAADFAINRAKLIYKAVKYRKSRDAML